MDSLFQYNWGQFRLTSTKADEAFFKTADNEYVVDDSSNYFKVLA